MSKAELEAVLRRPDTLKQILGNYRGPYSIGVIEPMHQGEQYAISLFVPDSFASPGRAFAILEGAQYPLIVQRGLQPLHLH